LHHRVIRTLLTRWQDEKKEDKDTLKAKLGRRFSARFVGMFNKTKVEVDTPAKVDEHPPKIDEPAPVAPLENPASESPAAVPPEATPVVATVA
jgi:hypothetical protein